MAGGRRRGCVVWVEKYFSDCVCDLKSGISFGLGMMSLVAWGVAEIPQIVTNFKTKSAHGVSLGLLLTWIVGDVFNLVGCLLEPATLPTQLYTAALYTLATVILVLQTIYYDYWSIWCRSRKFSEDNNMEEEEDDQKKPLNPKAEHHRHHDNDQKSKPIPTSYSPSRADVFYTSARSLVNSGSSPYGSSSAYLRTARSGPPTIRNADSESSSSEEDNQNNTSYSNRICGRRSSSKPNRTTSLSVGYGTFLAASAGLPRPTRALLQLHASLSSRKLLADTRSESIESGPYGAILGWIMAAIYMGGRLPQIYLNIKRGSVEGLNPLMFIFALIANATYVGSILVRSTEWKMIKANAPWLLDALVCVLLDAFIMVQYTYYRYFKRRATSSEDNEHDYYEEAKKPAA